MKNATIKRSLDIALEDVQRLCLGMAFLGTGGGGNPYLGSLMISAELEAGRVPHVIGLEDVPDDWLVVICATIGAPTVMTEKLPNASTTIAAMHRLQEHLGRKIDAVILGEAGGINGTLPLVVGAMEGLPVIDADGMGRAFPELPMVTFSIYGCSVTPLVLVDDFGQTAILDCENSFAAEKIARNVVVAMGAQAQFVAFPMTGAEVKRTAIAGSLSLALQIGDLIISARDANEDPVERLVSELNVLWNDRSCACLFEGKITDLKRETIGGFSRGRIVVSGDTTDRGCVMTVHFQNENTLAEIDGRPITMVPDLITVVDRETAEPITTEELKYGQRVAIIALTAPRELTTSKALDVVGPRAFGLDLDFTPFRSRQTG